ncbi:uncharacterized protein LOC113378425 [Ctenocephalides felis]|uniref:uncharacterized protein LOC113378425 n=1 Tax=Ctenocephalides felis TaxID=7515 RepID=UPI000E6E1E6E|nr:uncharacterized protein LOC113378425 [Ctenocephalides felis]
MFSQSFAVFLFIILVDTVISKPRLHIRVYVPEIVQHLHHTNTIYKHIHHHIGGNQTKPEEPKKHYHLHKHIIKPSDVTDKLISELYRIRNNDNNNYMHKYEVTEKEKEIMVTPPPMIYGFVPPSPTPAEHKHQTKPDGGKYEYTKFHISEGYNKVLPLIEEGSYGEVRKKGNSETIKITDEGSVYKKINSEHSDIGGKKDGGYYEESYHTKKTPKNFHGGSTSGKHEQEESKKEGDHEHNKGFSENVKYNHLTNEDSEKEHSQHSGNNSEEHSKKEYNKQNNNNNKEQEDNQQVYAIYYPVVHNAP